MKRYFCLLLIFIIVVISIVSCNQKEIPSKESNPMDSQVQVPQASKKQGLTILEVEGGDCLFPAKHKNEATIPEQDLEFYSEASKVGTQKTITFMNQSWTGTYQQTRRAGTYQSETDLYQGNNSEADFSFQVNQHTGEITSFLKWDRNYDPPEEKTLEECREIAQNFLKQRGFDLTKYELIYEQTSKADNTYLKVRDFEFGGIWEGMKTQEILNVSMTAFGDIYGFSRMHPISLQDLTMPTVAETEKLQGIFSEKMTAIYKDMLDTYDVRYSLEDPERILYRLKDGSFAIMYKFRAYVNKKTEDPQNAALDTTRFLVQW